MTTREQIIAAAKEAGVTYSGYMPDVFDSQDSLDRFYSLAFNAGYQKASDRIEQLEAENATLRTDFAELRDKVFTNGNCSFTMDDRTFTVEGDGLIFDNNFDFDATLRVTGDFVDDQKRQYAEMIAEVLNSRNARLESIDAMLDPYKAQIEQLELHLAKSNNSLGDEMTKNAALLADNGRLLDELLRVKEICLRELGIGLVNEVVLAATPAQSHARIRNQVLEDAAKKCEPTIWADVIRAMKEPE